MGAYHLSVENRQEDGEQGDRYIEKKIVLICTEVIGTTLDLCFPIFFSSPF